MFTLLAEANTENVTNSPTKTPAPDQPATEVMVKSFTETFTETYNQIIDLAPKVILVLALLIIGYFVARFLGRLATTLCEKVGLQTAATRSGLVESMKQVGFQRSIPAIVGTMIFWLVMCFLMMACFNILNLQTFSIAMQGVVLYIPNLLGATVVIVVGLLVATFLRGVVAASADRVGISYAQYLANGCYYVLVMMTFIAAFEQLKIEFELLNYAILIVFGALAVAFGLAVGLGGRDVVAGIMAGYYVRQRMQSGDHVEMGKLEGVVREVGPVATIIETDDDGLMNRHSVPNIKMLNEAVR